MKISLEELKELQPNNKVIYCCENGKTTDRYISRIVSVTAWRLDFAFDIGERHPKTIPWSKKTNKPIGQFGKGYVGKVWLERLENKLG